MATDLCTCRDVKVGGRSTGARNLDDECPIHGIGTPYYRQQAEKWGKRLRELREQKRDALDREEE